MQETVCLFESSVAHHPLLLKNWCVEPVHLMCVESLWHLSVPLIKHRMRRNRNHPFSGSICGFCPISLVSALSEQNSICCFFSNKNNNKCPLLCNLVGLFCCFTWLCCFAVSLGCVVLLFHLAVLLAVSGAVDLRFLLPTGLPDGDAAELRP